MVCKAVPTEAEEEAQVKREWVLEWESQYHDWRREERLGFPGVDCKPAYLGWLAWHFTQAKKRWKWKEWEWRMRNLNTGEIISCVILV